MANGHDWAQAKANSVPHVSSRDPTYLDHLLLSQAVEGPESWFRKSNQDLRQLSTME